MKAHFRDLILLTAMAALPVPSPAQDVAGQHIQVEAQRHWYVTGKVSNLQGDPIAGALVNVIATNVIGQHEIIETTLQGEFFRELNPLEHLRTLALDLTVTRPGFLKAHVITELSADAEKTWVIPITLRDKDEDPDLLAQADLISGLIPRLKKLGVSDGLSASAEKDYTRGVRELLDQKNPDRALPFFAKVAQHDRSCVACRTMLGLVELESGDWDGATRDLSEASDRSKADRTAGRPEPMLVLGVMQSWRHEPERAAGYFVEALKFAPQDRLALQELGRSQLLIQNWPAAAEKLREAIDAGSGPEARLMRAQALLGEGHAEEANKEITRYLDGREVRTMPPRVRQIWVQVQSQKKVEATYAKVKTEVDQPIDYLRRTTPDLKGLESDEDQKPLESILTGVGKDVREFFRSFPNTSSLEKVHQQKLKGNGKGGEKQDQKFQYLCVTPAQAWGPGFSEYRSNLPGNEGQSTGLAEGFMVTSGFAAASLIFHPVYQSEATFRYLGRQKVNGRDSYVVAFAQHPIQAHVYGLFKDGKNESTIFVQGLAWIDSQNYQILRLRTDLLKALPEVALKRQTTEISFSEVHFKSITAGFWLPREVAVTVDWHGKVLRNDHEYSDFKIFNVDSTQKIGKPKELAQTSKEVSDPEKPR